MNKQSFIPEGYNAVTPALAFKGADAAIKWYVNVFGAKEKMHPCSDRVLGNYPKPANDNHLKSGQRRS